MVTPSNPSQEGSAGVQHDDRKDSSHEEEVDKAGGQSNGGDGDRE